MLSHGAPAQGCVSLPLLCAAPEAPRAQTGLFSFQGIPFLLFPSPRAHEREQIPALPALLQQQLPLGIISQFSVPKITALELLGWQEGTVQVPRVAVQ